MFELGNLLEAKTMADARQDHLTPGARYAGIWSVVKSAFAHEPACRAPAAWTGSAYPR